MKQKLSILLAVVLLLSLFSGCALLGDPSSRKSLISDDFRAEGDGYFLTAEDGRVYVNYRPEQTAQASRLSVVQPCLSIPAPTFSACSTMEALLEEVLSGTADAAVYKYTFSGDSEKVLMFDSRYLNRVIPSEGYSLFRVIYSVYSTMIVDLISSSEPDMGYPDSVRIEFVPKVCDPTEGYWMFPGYERFPESGTDTYTDIKRREYDIYVKTIDGQRYYVMERKTGSGSMEIFFEKYGVHWHLAPYFPSQDNVSLEEWISIFTIEPFTTDLETLLKKAS